MSVRARSRVEAERDAPIANPPYINPPIAEKILALEPGKVVSEMYAALVACAVLPGGGPMDTGAFQARREARGKKEASAQVS